MRELTGKYIRYLKVERNSSPHTIKSYQKDLDDFTVFLEDYDPGCLENPDTINRFAIRAWMGELSEKGLTHKSIARKVSALKSFFKYAYARGHVNQNPAQLVTLPKAAKKLPSHILEDQTEELLGEFTCEKPFDYQEKAILELLYATGLRLSELISVNAADVSAGNDLIRVMGKGSKERFVPFGGKAREAIDEWLLHRKGFLKTESTDDDRRALFLCVSGKRIYPVAVQRIVKKHIERVSEVKQKSPHVLRHSFATHLLNKGADIRVIKELLGHSALTSTQVYTHTSVDHLKKVHENAHPRGS
jgi:tyrosine recombinase XerC